MMILTSRICFRAFDVCVPDDVLVEEEHSNSLPSLMTPSITSGMSLSMDMPRKRKGSTDNQLVLLIHLIWLKYTKKTPTNPVKLCVYFLSGIQNWLWLVMQIWKMTKTGALLIFKGKQIFLCKFCQNKFNLSLWIWWFSLHRSDGEDQHVKIKCFR